MITVCLRFGGNNRRRLDRIQRKLLAFAGLKGLVGEIPGSEVQEFVNELALPMSRLDFPGSQVPSQIFDDYGLATHPANNVNGHFPTIDLFALGYNGQTAIDCLRYVKQFVSDCFSRVSNPG